MHELRSKRKENVRIYLKSLYNDEELEPLAKKAPKTMRYDKSGKKECFYDNRSLRRSVHINGS